MDSADVLQLKTQIAELKTSVAIISNNVESLTEFFTMLKKTTEKIYEIHTDMAVQDTIMVNYDKRITSLETLLQTHHDEEQEFRRNLNERLDSMKKTTDEQREKSHTELVNALTKLTNASSGQEDRIVKLENWRWYVIGIVTVIGFISTKIPLDKVFS